MAVATFRPPSLVVDGQTRTSVWSENDPPPGPLRNALSFILGRSDLLKANGFNARIVQDPTILLEADVEAASRLVEARRRKVRSRPPRRIDASTPKPDVLEHMIGEPAN